MEFVGFDTIVDLVNEEILSFYEIENNKIFQKRRENQIKLLLANLLQNAEGQND